MIIKFRNWKKFNTRRGGIKQPKWFCFDHDFFHDSKTYALDADEQLTLIYLLCEASKANNEGELMIIPAHHRVHCRVLDREPEDVLNRCISKLKQLQIIDQPRVRGMYASRTRSERQIRIEGEEKRLEEIRITNLADSVFTEPRRVFDFDALYKKYPRKEGKQRGLAICKVQVKTLEDYESLRIAIERYTAHIAKNATEPRFIKQFSSFMASWRDWLDADVGTVQKPKAEEPEWKRQAREEEARHASK